MSTLQLFQKNMEKTQQRSWPIIILLFLCGCNGEGGPARSSSAGEMVGGEAGAGENSRAGEQGGEVVDCAPNTTGLDSAVEVCDEVDNDCDGIVDEGFEELGTPCERRLMSCLTQGVQVCGPDGQLKCDAPSIDPSDEVCDEVDNDCDGMVDENFSLLIDRDHCGACGQQCDWPNGVGRCEMGVCVLTSCESGFEDLNGDPSDGCECSRSLEEICDGIDNDCDQRIDEAFGVNSLCTVGFGSCEVSGVFACVSEDRAACNVSPLPATGELCDGIDNDCDQKIDEDFDLDGDGIPACPVCDSCLMSDGPDCPDFCSIHDCHDDDINVSPIAWDQCEDGQDQNCDGEDAPCSIAYARATALAIVSATSSQMTCPDLNGDGIGDNAFGQISGIANPATQMYINSFNMNLIVGAYQFDLARPDNRFTLSVILGTHYRNSNPPAFLARTTNYDEFGRPRMRFPYAQITDGLLSAGPGTFVFSAPFVSNGMTTLIEVPIEDAYIRGNFELDPNDPTKFNLSNGLVSGYINKQNLEDSFILLDPPIVAVIQSLIQPDLDLNRDGIPDYYSICLITTLTGVGVTVEEVEPTP